MPHPTDAQDSAASRNTSLSSLLAAWLCAATSLGCPAAQVKPQPANCPTEATDAMFKELKIWPDHFLRALIDVNQPETEAPGLYQEGPVVGSITAGSGLLVPGTLLYGHLWTGPGLMDRYGRESVTGRYTKAVLPDGKTYPVCIALGGPNGRMRRTPGSKPGTVELERNAPVGAVWRWP